MLLVEIELCLQWQAVTLSLAPSWQTEWFHSILQNKSKKIKKWPSVFWYVPCIVWLCLTWVRWCKKKYFITNFIDFTTFWKGGGGVFAHLNTDSGMLGRAFCCRTMLFAVEPGISVSNHAKQQQLSVIINHNSVIHIWIHQRKILALEYFIDNVRRHARTASPNSEVVGWGMTYTLPLPEWHVTTKPDKPILITIITWHF